jgi:hypothetical protein
MEFMMRELLRASRKWKEDNKNPSDINAKDLQDVNINLNCIN